MKKNQGKFPSKTTINLAVTERTINSPSRIIPLAVLVVVLLLLFSKFAVADRLVALSRDEAALTAQQQQLAALQVDEDEYQRVSVEYARYTSDWLSPEESAIVDRQRIFDLIEQQIFPHAALRRCSIEQNTVTLELLNLSLSDASAIVSSLKAQEDVIDVAVSSAGIETSATAGAASSVTMVITMTNGNPLPTEDTAQPEGGDENAVS